MSANPACSFLRAVFLFFCMFQCKPGLFLYLSSANPAYSLFFHPLYVSKPGLYYLRTVFLFFLLYVWVQARPLPVPFFYKPGRLPAFSSSVCLQTWPVSFLCMFENPACSFSVSVCLKTWPIPFLCVSAGPVYSCSFFCVSAKPAYSLFFILCMSANRPGLLRFFSCLCLQTQAIPALLPCMSDLTSLSVLV